MSFQSIICQNINQIRGLNSGKPYINIQVTQNDLQWLGLMDPFTEDIKKRSNKKINVPIIANEHQNEITYALIVQVDMIEVYESYYNSGTTNRYLDISGAYVLFDLVTGVRIINHPFSFHNKISKTGSKREIDQSDQKLIAEKISDEFYKAFNDKFPFISRVKNVNNGIVKSDFIPQTSYNFFIYKLDNYFEKYNLSVLTEIAQADKKLDLPIDSYKLTEDRFNLQKLHKDGETLFFSSKKIGLRK